MFEAIVFDMDGVLVDSEPIHYATTNEVLGARGAWIARADYDGYLGMDELAFFAELVRRFGLDDPPQVLARERIALSLGRLAQEPLPPLPGVLELILALRGEGRAMAVASSASRHQVRLVLDRLGITGCMQAIISKDDVQAGKPAPDLYLAAAAGLSLDPSCCLAIEDAALGVASARAAGMTVLALVPAGSDDTAHREAGARACLSGLEGLSVERLDALAAAAE
ncbi:MAG: HAD family phosphatase [Planctomycetota bacterium]|nr:MAG: HAD family phosphatase [Planctomycetota bacterium]